MRDFDERFRTFDADFERMQQQAKKASRFVVAMFVLQALVYVALAVGIIYLIMYAITHWLRW